MKLGSVLLCLLCVWALCNFWLLPLAKDRWIAVNLRAKLTRTGSLVVLEKIRDLSAIGALVLTTVIGLIWATGLLAVTSIGVPQAVIAATSSLYQATKSFAEEYGAALGVIGLIGAVVALILAARQAKQKVAQAWMDKAQEIHARLREDPSGLEAARDDAELQPLVRKFDELIAALSAHDSGDREIFLSDEQVEGARHHASALFSALSVELAQKELKFDEVIGRAAGNEPSPAGFWSRLARVISSDKLGKDLGFIKKPLSYVTTALLVFSLLGWSAEPLANSLQLAVNNLRVNLLDKKAQQDFAGAISTAPNSNPGAAATAASAAAPSAVTGAHTAQSAARFLARAAVDEMAHSGALDRIIDRGDRPFSSDAEFVRNAINQQHLDADLSSDISARVRQEVAEGVAQSGNETTVSSKAQEAIERELAPELERFKAQRPGRFQQWMQAVEQRYATPMGTMDAQSKLMSQVFEDAFSTLDAKPSTELGKQAQKLVKDFGKEAVKTWASSWAKSWVTDTIIEGARPGVRAGMDAFVFEVSQDTRTFVDDLTRAEGRGWVSSADHAQETKAMRAVAEKIASLHEPELQAGLRERLGGYDELFPKDAPNIPEASTGMGNIGGAGGGSGAGKRGGAHPSAPHGVFAQSRATNFHLASRSFRVRGVLIGQDMPVSGVRLNGIQWVIQPHVAEQSTRVSLRVRQGEVWRDLGLFDAGVVNQALRYAADRRVVATTITPGDGKVVGRVTYLHPVLADTPLGCRIVEADRFIDTFTFTRKGQQPSAQLATLASDRKQMGPWMLVARLTEALATVPESRACPRQELDKLVESQNLGAIRFSSALQSSLDEFISKQEKDLPGSGRVLSAALTCATLETSKVVGCLCEKSKGIKLPAQYLFPEDHTSQFREKPTKGGPDWTWMQRSTDHLANIDLWVHTTFSLRRSGNGETDLDEATARAVDFPAEGLQALRQQMSAVLPNYLRDSLVSPSYDDFMAPLEDFIVLQRLFRSGLAGDLGHEFPIGQLVRLEQQTRKFVPRQPTIRWESAQAASPQLLETLTQADPAAARAYQQWSQDMRRRLVSHMPMCDRVSM